MNVLFAGGRTHDRTSWDWARGCACRCVEITLLVLARGISAAADVLTVTGFNVESGDASPQVIATYIQGAGPTDLWGLCEVEDASWLAPIENAAEAVRGTDYRSILGTTGGADRLAILYDDEIVQEVRHQELHNVNVDGRVRAPLFAEFRVRTTGTVFIFMVNHLYRRDDQGRRLQAARLNAWATTQSLPIVAVGDYNFDWNVHTGRHDPGFDQLTRNDVFVWLKPSRIIKTQCSSRYNSILDFIFVSGPAKAWKASSVILYPEPDYCPDDSRKSDHRPVQATLEIP
ncbi:MAG: endonuclease/exonuclease/phosphatase [Candidatus Hydrogenedentes bacterium]|nr:endonuclease/exonuclease/phosphatase [Candidatus Hydrogenedentota bacterium]